jgi:hypothetical protein
MINIRKGVEERFTNEVRFFYLGILSINRVRATIQQREEGERDSEKKKLTHRRILTQD